MHPSKKRFLLSTADSFRNFYFFCSNICTLDLQNGCEPSWKTPQTNITSTGYAICFFVVIFGDRGKIVMGLPSCFGGLKNKGLVQGSLNYPFCGGMKQYKCNV